MTASDVTRLRFVAPLRSRTPPLSLKGEIAFLPMESIGDDGTFDRSNTRDADAVVGQGYTYFEDGDVIRARVTPCFENGKGALLARLCGGKGLGTTELFVFVPGPNVDPRFLYYVVSSRDFTEQGTATIYGAHGVRRVHEDFARDYAAWMPALATQRAIADYLDRETTRLDALIASKQRMVELLDERFAAFAHLSSIGGVGEVERRLSPSGIYGSIPRTWAETPLRHLGCEVQTGPFGSQLHAEEYIEDGWPVVNPMNIVGGRIAALDHMMISLEKRTELSRHILAEGDIVFGRRGEMGRAGLVGPDQVGWLCGTGSLRLRLTGAVLVPDYLQLLLRTPPAKAYFSLSSVGSTMENLNSEIVLAFPALVPPIDEQLAIVEQVQQAMHERERLIDVLRKQVSLLGERRQALVAAAVTGHLDISETA